MSQILALEPLQIVLIVLIAVLVIAYPLLMIRRNKKENQRVTEQTNSLKRGDKILTTSGVYGTIIDIKLEGTAKQVTIETGSGAHKSYMTVDAYAIYQVIKDQPQVAKDITEVETKAEEDKKLEEKNEKPAKSQSKKSKSKTQEKKDELSSVEVKEEAKEASVVEETNKADKLDSKVEIKEEKVETKQTESKKPARSRAKKS